jgi:hypothetical protein
MEYYQALESLKTEKMKSVYSVIMMHRCTGFRQYQKLTTHNTYIEGARYVQLVHEKNEII